MDLRQLATFRAVATARSFTMAADQLGYAQSSVTAQIQTLEHELGTPLFDRLGRRIALTEAGQRLLTYAGRMLDLADEAKRSLLGDDEPEGTLTITAPETVCSYRLPEVLRAFRERYPRVLLRFRPVPIAELRRSVLEGAVDLAFIMDEPLRAGTLCVEPLAPEPLLVVAPPGHRLTHLPEVRPNDLEGETVLLKEAACTYRALFQRALALAGVRDLDTSLEFATVEAIKQCVMADMGISVLAAVTVERELADRRLVALPWSVPDFQLWTQMVWHRDRWISPGQRAFMDLARALLGRVAVPA